MLPSTQALPCWHNQVWYASINNHIIVFLCILYFIIQRLYFFAKTNIFYRYDVVDCAGIKLYCHSFTLPRSLLNTLLRKRSKTILYFHGNGEIVGISSLPLPRLSSFISLSSPPLLLFLLVTLPLTVTTADYVESKFKQGLEEAGFNIFFVEYRGYGHSDGYYSFIFFIFFHLFSPLFPTSSGFMAPSHSPHLVLLPFYSSLVCPLTIFADPCFLLSAIDSLSLSLFTPPSFLYPFSFLFSLFFGLFFSLLLSSLL